MAEISVKKNKIAASREDKIFYAIAYVVFTFVLLLCAYPFYYLLIATVSDSHLVDLGQVTLYPKGFQLTDNLIIVGVAVFLPTGFTDFLQGINDNQLGVRMLPHKAVKLVK